MTASELCFTEATELARMIREKQVSCLELMQAHLSQIERVNPRVNAVVTLLPERALEGARAADAELARNSRRQDGHGVLFGLPIAHKDLLPTAGIRTTFGSPIFADHVPTEDALLVQRLRAAGAITIGKTNTPEFGAGSQTFNPVFGATLNPYDTGKTCGGSSGGAAVALACGMLPIADGSDLGGSLRNPASFCNVVGFRNALGRVPAYPSAMGWSSIAVVGAMARTVRDTALMLSAIAGPDDRAPISIREPGERFREPLERDFAGVRVAWAPAQDGLPVDKRVLAVLERARPVFAALGCELSDACPDFGEAEEVFQTLRAWSMDARYGELLATHRHQMKDTVIWNIERGQKLSGADVARAEVLRTTLYHRMRSFMETHEYLVTTTNQVPAFDVKQPYVTEIEGQKLGTYIDWMRACWNITATGHPAISVPAGFTDDGLPVGIQIVGRHQADFSVLQLAHAFEQATRHAQQRPELAQ